TYWVPGVNHLGTYGRWAFAEFTSVLELEADFTKKIESEFNKLIESSLRGHGGSIDVLRNRAADHVRSQLGKDPRLSELNSRIWDAIASSSDQSFSFASLYGDDRSATDAESTLSILSLLSSPSVQLLRMKLSSA